MSKNICRLAIIGAAGRLGEKLVQMCEMRNFYTVCGVRDHRKIKVFNTKSIFCKSNKDCIEYADAVILSVKPGNLEEVCQDIVSFVPNHVPVISVASTVQLSTLEKWLPETEIIIRCMPNLACSKDVGVVAWSSNQPDLASKYVQEIFAPNLIFQVDNDSEIDISTIISGCGPAAIAYFGLMMERLATVESNLTPNQIHQIVSQVLIGTGQLMLTESSAGIIRNTASPGGLTELMIEEIDKMGFYQILSKTLHTLNSRTENCRTESSKE